MKRALVIVIALCSTVCFGQVVASPQYTLNINFFGSGVYGTTTAVNNVFGYQLTTNVQLVADLLAAPGGGVNDYEGGAAYNLCGIKGLENALALTSLNCGKIEPFFSVTGGEGRVQQGSSPVQTAPAFMAKVGINMPTASGTYSIPLMAGYGYFGPSVVGQSNKGFFFYSGITFGGGTSASATQAKIARIKHSDAKKMARLQAKMAKAQQ
jgi:hypothetical protein